MPELPEVETVRRVLLTQIKNLQIKDVEIRYDKIVVASSTYNMGIFPWMEHFLLHLQGKNYQNRKVGIIENGSWAPMSGKLMKEMFTKMKDITICEPMVTIKSAMKDENIEQMKKLADELLED